MSGHPEETVFEAGILDTSRNFLYKPIDADRLARVIRETLNRHQHAARAKVPSPGVAYAMSRTSSERPQLASG
jgi:hypothetical protein